MGYNLRRHFMDSKVIDCPKCGFRHLDPIPEKDEIENFYESQYYQEGETRLRNFELSFEKEKREDRWASLAWKDRLQVFEEHIKQHPRRLLDVGCGNGFFLKFMKKKGWEVTGVEPSSVAYECAKSLGSQVFNMTLEQFAGKDQSLIYDAINLKNVLEHVRNPGEILKICKSLLNQSYGIICVQVPNEFNLFQLQVEKVLNKPSYWVAIPDHINYFDFGTLERLLENMGFKVILRMADFPMELFLLMGDNYIENKGAGGKCHQKRMNFEMALPDDIRRRIYMKLASLGLGRSCIVYAKVQ